jgi:D-alanyl-D-alanine carboxypeptidase
MSYQNGRLPASALRRIHHPSVACYLEIEAAIAFEAMRQESLRRYGIDLYPLGPVSAYRPIAAQQHFWDLYVTGHGNLAARPGTSNHGWGRAVDLATPRMRWVVNQIGWKYGWRKIEAPSEWWHVNYVGGYHKPAPKPDPLRVLTANERKLVNRLEYHRALMVKELKSGKGPKYQANLKWARWYKAQIRKQMNAIVIAYHQHRDWSIKHRGARYQVLRKAYNNTL